MEPYRLCSFRLLSTSVLSTLPDCLVNYWPYLYLSTLQHESFVFQTVELVREDKQPQKGRQAHRRGKPVAESLRAELQRGDGEYEISDKKTRRDDEHFPAGVKVKEDIEYCHQQYLHADRHDVDIEQMDV